MGEEVSVKTSRRVVLAIWGIVGLAFASCGKMPNAPPQTDSAQASMEAMTDAPTPSPTPFKAELVVCTSQEPDTLISSTSPIGAAVRALTIPSAVTYDTNYLAVPNLLSSLPNEANGSLKRRDDGTIE